MPQSTHTTTVTSRPITARAAAGLMRMPDILELTGMSRSWVYREARLGRFPAPVRLPGTSSAVWWRADVERWLATLESQTQVEA